MTTTSNRHPACFGFSFKRGGVHTARTMMLAELRQLLSYVNDPKAKQAAYLHAIVSENCLGKRSSKTRLLTYRHLAGLYALDPSVILFRSLMHFWHRDPSAQPLLALLCAYARDAVLRSTDSFILPSPREKTIHRQDLETFIEAQEPGRFSKSTLTSTTRNINSTWTQAGHLAGRRQKSRTQALASAGSASYALLLGYLLGIRGKALFSTAYARLLDCSCERRLQLAEDASRRGWIVCKRVGDVIEVLFPRLINAREMECLDEQNQASYPIL